MDIVKQLGNSGRDRLSSSKSMQFIDISFRSPSNISKESQSKRINSQLSQPSPKKKQHNPRIAVYPSTAQHPTKRKSRSNTLTTKVFRPIRLSSPRWVCFPSGKEDAHRRSSRKEAGRPMRPSAWIDCTFSMFAIIITKVTEGMKAKGRKGKALEQIHSFYCE